MIDWTTLAGGLVLVASSLLAAWRLHVVKLRRMEAKLAAERRAERRAEDDARAAAIAELEHLRAELRRKSDPPDSLEHQEREQRRAAARSAGFRPGDTGSFAAMHDLGPMRCNAHDGMVAAADANRAASEASTKAADMATAAASQAATAAGLATASAERLGAMVERIEERFATWGEWKGEVGARLTAVERDVSAARRGGGR